MTLRQSDRILYRDTRHEDQVILVQAMMAVVLRRDLSLSRRLYTWLLGPSDGSATQLEFYRQHGLELLRQAVIAEMQTFSSSPDATLAQRPYKIVISLLDKWEISFPLIEVVVLDLLRQLEKVLSAETFHPEVGDSTTCTRPSILNNIFSWSRQLTCFSTRLTRFLCGRSCSRAQNRSSSLLRPEQMT